MGLYDTAQQNAPGQTQPAADYTVGAKNLWTDSLKREYDTQQGMMYGNPEFTPDKVSANNAKWIDAYGAYPTSASQQPAATAKYATPAAPTFAPIAAAPVYKGLMDGDYNALQASLAVGGRQAAENAYNTGTQNLNNTMSGRGLYGSSIMQQQQTQGLGREYMRAQAANEANAAATRYGMQQADLKTGFDGAMQGYGINTTATTASNALQGQMYMNAADIASKNYGVDQDVLSKKYGYDTQANSSILHDKSVSDTAIMTNSTKLQEIQGLIESAKARGDNDLVASLTATAAGLYGTNFEAINGAVGSGLSALGSWGSGLMDGWSTDSGLYGDSSYLGDGQLWD